MWQVLAFALIVSVIGNVHQSYLYTRLNKQIEEARTSHQYALKQAKQQEQKRCEETNTNLINDSELDDWLLQNDWLIEN